MNEHNIKDSSKVQIQYYGAIRAAAEKSGEDMEVPSDTTAYRLLQKLAAVYGEPFHDEIFQESDDKLRDDLTLSVNGTIVNHAAADKIMLKQGDAVAVFPIFPGGG